MELMQLRYFQVVALNQHITRSAEQLNVSQPAISVVTVSYTHLRALSSAASDVYKRQLLY